MPGSGASVPLTQRLGRSSLSAPQAILREGSPRPQLCGSTGNVWQHWGRGRGARLGIQAVNLPLAGG